MRQWRAWAGAAVSAATHEVHPPLEAPGLPPPKGLLIDHVMVTDVLG